MNTSPRAIVWTSILTSRLWNALADDESCAIDACDSSQANSTPLREVIVSECSCMASHI